MLEIRGIQAIRLIMRLFDFDIKEARNVVDCFYIQLHPEFKGAEGNSIFCIGDLLFKETDEIANFIKFAKMISDGNAVIVIYGNHDYGVIVPAKQFSLDDLIKKI